MKIVYYSGSGNTEKMANLIAEGIKEEGKTAELINVSSAGLDVFDNEDIVILGCPAMGDEVLEEAEFEHFMEGISDKISGKKVALFGSYGWGDGQWMRDWQGFVFHVLTSACFCNFTGILVIVIISCSCGKSNWICGFFECGGLKIGMRCADIDKKW